MKRTLYQFLLLLLLLTGCNDPKPVTDALTRAETLMNEYPDSAWAVLNTLSPDEMGQNRTRAHYALLYTQAQDKTYRDETNDSLISIAVDYYRHTDDARRKFLSYYYKGRVYTNAKDYLNATSCYIEAEQLSDAVGDDYLTGLLYAELGRIYRLYYDYPKSLEAYQKAAECYERAGKTRHRNYMWYNQSTICRNMNRYEESERFLRMALTSAKEAKDMALVELCLGNLVMLCIEEDRMVEAQTLYAELELLIDEGHGSSSFVAKLSKMYLSERDFICAKQCIETGWHRAVNRKDSIQMFFSSASLLSALGKDKTAYAELMKGVSLQTDEAHQALQQPVLTAQRDYLSEKLEFDAYKLRMEKKLRVLYVLFFSVLLLAVSWMLWRKLKRKKMVINELERKKEHAEQRIFSLLQQLDDDKRKAGLDIEKLKGDIVQKEKSSNARISDLLLKLEQGENMIESLKRTLTEKEEDRQKMEVLVQQLENDSKQNSQIVVYLRTELKRQEAESRHTFDRLVEMFRNSIFTMGEIMLDFEEIKAPNTLLDNVIRQWKKNYFIGSKALRNLERLVNEFHDDAMSHFRKEVRLHDKEDYQLVCYMFAGVSVKVIAWLTSKSENGVYQWRIRLRDKIKISDQKHKDLFLKLLDK